MRRNTILSALATLFVAGMLNPMAGGAQTVNVAEAERLEQKAVSFNLADFVKVANGLVRAASLRSDTDPLGVTDLLSAGNAYYVGGKLDRARVAFVQAGDRALAMGDVVHAAQGYLHAAIIANQQGDPVRDVLIAKANRLAASPLLTEPHRRAILGQFKQPLQVAEHPTGVR